MMYCRHCGREIPNDVAFCPECGTPVRHPVQPAAPADRRPPAAPPKKKRNTGLIIALVVIILAILLVTAGLIFYIFRAETPVSERQEAYSEREEERGPTRTEPPSAPDTSATTADDTAEPPEATEATTEPPETTEAAPEPTAETSAFGPYEYSGDYLIEGSDSRYVSFGDVAWMEYRDIQMAINEIYARRGRKFDTPEIRAYFESKWWYRGTIDPSDFNDDMLNDYEKANIAFLLEERDKHEQP